MPDSNPYDAPKAVVGRPDDPVDAAEEQRDNIGFTAQMVRFTAVLCVVAAAFFIRSASRGFKLLEYDKVWSFYQTFSIFDCAFAIGFGITAFCCWRFSTTLISVANDKDAEQGLVESQAYVWMSIILMFFLFGLKHVVSLIYFGALPNLF